VDLIACLRFMHHVAHAEDRLRLLAELKRVSREYAVLSAWVDGNLKSLLQPKRQATLVRRGYGPRTCRSRAELQDEFHRSGFDVAGIWDVWPGISRWRLYLLRHAT
jgi:hypothetical protein